MTEPVPRIITGEIIGPVDATQVPRYGGRGHLRPAAPPDEVAQADVAILGVPFDSGVSYRPGARFGPAHIRESSRLLRPYNPALQVPVFAASRSPTPATWRSTRSASTRRSPRSSAARGPCSTEPRSC